MPWCSHCPHTVLSTYCPQDITVGIHYPQPLTTNATATYYKCHHHVAQVPQPHTTTHTTTTYHDTTATYHNHVPRVLPQCTTNATTTYHGTTATYHNATTTPYHRGSTSTRHRIAPRPPRTTIRQPHTTVQYPRTTSISDNARLDIDEQHFPSLPEPCRTL